MKENSSNIVWFILKPSAINQDIRAYFEKNLQENLFQILSVAEKELIEPEVDSIHCVVGPRKCNEKEYKQYMTSGITLGYLVRHDNLYGEALFSFCCQLRGSNVEAYKCSETSLRKLLHEQLLTTGYKINSSVENHIHATDSVKELKAFLQIYFPDIEVL